METQHIILGVFLFILASALIVAEVFVPSAGILTIFALASLAGGVTVFFYHGGSAYGIAGVVVAAVLIPTVLIIAYRIFPKTSFGKSVLLTPPKRTPGDAIADSQRLSRLLGQRGLAISSLRPVGICDFSDLRVECVAESGYVEKGKTVEVIKVVSTQLTVRVVESS